MTSIVPEVNERTRVLAILGNTEAGPDGDDWMYADYALLNQLLGGQGIEQVWLHANKESFATALQLHGPILHGSPDRERKVVFDGVTATLRHLQEVEEKDLKLLFLSELDRMVNESQAGDRLLIILIGHGQVPPVCGLHIGDHVDDDQTYLLGGNDVLPILDNLRVDVQRCILCTSCFGCNWICSSASSSTMAPDDDQNMHLFTEAFSDTLRASQAKTSTYQEFTSEIEANPENLFPLLLDVSPPVFSAQNNAWGSSTEAVTGVAQENHRARYNALRSVPANQIPESLRASLHEHEARKEHNAR